MTRPSSSARLRAGSAVWLAWAMAFATSGARGAESADAAAAPAAPAATAASAVAGSASAPSVGLGVPRKVPSDAVDYAIPALEIIGFDFLVNRLNYHFGSEKEDYAVTAESIRRNLKSGWSSDRDPFNINQLGHPYQGSMYH